MLNVNTTKITIVDETTECLSRQMMLTYYRYTVADGKQFENTK